MKYTGTHDSRALYRAVMGSCYSDVVGCKLNQGERDRDLKEIDDRLEKEGIEFFTKTMPSLGKALNRALSTGLPLVFDGFKKAANTNLPRFMHGMFRKVFRLDGVPWLQAMEDTVAQSLHVEPNYRNGHVEWYDCQFLDNILFGSEPATVAEREYWEQYLYYLPHDESVHEVVRPRSNRVIGEPEALYKGFRAHCVSLLTYLVHSKVDDEMATKRLAALKRAGFDPLDSVKIGETSSNNIDWDALGRSLEEVLRREMVHAVYGLRQVLLLFYKLKLPYTHAQKQATLASFIEAERELEGLDHQSSLAKSAIVGIARTVVRRILANADPQSGIPRHGPGSVATGESSSGKSHCPKRYYRRLDEKYPYDKWFYYNPSHLADELSEHLQLEELEYGTAKVVLVPKDSRGPRLISCEPLEYQWIQQAQMRVLVDTIQKHPWTRGRVNFTRQTVNQELALANSHIWLYAGYVTLDMKEASDRVGLSLVRELFPDSWFEALYASRTPETKLPDGTLVQMKKFAPMGSAVCFPVEALVFYALCVAIQHIYMNVPLMKAAKTTFVYGDDIIVLGDVYPVIRQWLPEFGLKLNDDKCCTTSFFKESCGVDAYFGTNVTPTYIRSVLDPRRKSTESIASWVAYSNAFYAGGLYSTAQLLQDVLDEQWYGSIRVTNSLVKRFEPRVPSAILRRYKECGSSRNTIPVVTDDVVPSGLAFVRSKQEADIWRRYNVTYWDRKTQRLVAPTLQFRCLTETSDASGWRDLLRITTQKGAVPSAHEAVEDYTSPDPSESLPSGVYPIANRVKLQLAWTPVG